MKRSTRLHAVAVAALSCLLTAGLASVVLASEQSSCVTCHLDIEMLVKNLTVANAKKSTMQSGAG